MTNGVRLQSGERAEGHEPDDEAGEGEADAPGARGARTPEHEGADDDLCDRQGEPHPGPEGHVLDERRVLVEDVRPAQRRDAGDDVEGAGDDEVQADELDPAAAPAGLVCTCHAHSFKSSRDGRHSTAAPAAQAAAGARLRCP